VVEEKTEDEAQVREWEVQGKISVRIHGVARPIEYHLIHGKAMVNLQREIAST